MTTPEQAAKQFLIDTNRLTNRMCSVETAIVLQELNILTEIIYAHRESAVAEAMAWRPISTAPKDGEFIQLFVPDLGQVKGFQSVCRWLANDEGFAGWYDASFGLVGGDGVDEPTHWMPLPPAPTEVVQETKWLEELG